LIEVVSVTAEAEQAENKIINAGAIQMRRVGFRLRFCIVNKLKREKVSTKNNEVHGYRIFLFIQFLI